MDGTEDLQVVDDALWGQVVLQCGCHHRAGHVLSINRWNVSDLQGLSVPQPQLQLYARYWRVICRSVPWCHLPETFMPGIGSYHSYIRHHMCAAVSLSQPASYHVILYLIDGIPFSLSSPPNPAGLNC